MIRQIVRPSRARFADFAAKTGVTIPQSHKIVAESQSQATRMLQVTRMRISVILLVMSGIIAMRKSLISLCVFVCALPLMAAYADGDQPVAQTPATPAAAPVVPPAGNEIICKRQEAATGSRIGARRICKTAEQWRQDQLRTYETMQNLQQWQTDQATNGARPGGN